MRKTEIIVSVAFITLLVIAMTAIGWTEEENAVRNTEIEETDSGVRIEGSRRVGLSRLCLNATVDDESSDQLAVCDASADLSGIVLGMRWKESTPIHCSITPDGRIAQVMAHGLVNYYLGPFQLYSRSVRMSIAYSADGHFSPKGPYERIDTLFIASLLWQILNVIFWLALFWRVWCIIERIQKRKVVA